MNSYEICSDTLAIMPKNNNNSIVYEKNNIFLVNLSVEKIMDNSCKYFGSTLNGRKAGASNLLNISYKIYY